MSSFLPLFSRLRQTSTRCPESTARPLELKTRPSVNQSAKSFVQLIKPRPMKSVVAAGQLYSNVVYPPYAHTSTLDTKLAGSSETLCCNKQLSSACACNISGTIIPRSSSIPANMTFTEMCNACESKCEKKNITIGQALEKCLSRAVASERVTVGVQECAKLLGCAPERVMLCLIPDMASSPDVGMHIQHTLVRSFCWENDIRLLTVKDTDKLRHLFNLVSTVPKAGSQLPEAESGGQSAPVSCVLIEVPTEDLSPDEEFICNYHDTVIYSDIFPKPIIQLP